jgi:hypothetical protein
MMDSVSASKTIRFLLKSIKSAKKLSEINLGGKWNFVSSPQVDSASCWWRPNCQDISGSWSGYSEVKEIEEGTSPIPVGMKRSVSGDKFVILKAIVTSS